jgi:hypothetical protein
MKRSCQAASGLVGVQSFQPWLPEIILKVLTVGFQLHYVMPISFYIGALIG